MANADAEIRQLAHTAGLTRAQSEAMLATNFDVYGVGDTPVERAQNAVKNCLAGNAGQAARGISPIAEVLVPKAAQPKLAPKSTARPPSPPVAKTGPTIAEISARASAIDAELAALKGRRLAAENTAALAAEARAREARREELDRAFQTGAHAQDARRTTSFDGITQTFGVGVAR
ncbi:MAG: hypothetical protein EOO73_34240 [Myxococcales bacterium]|nr:MAG: hypothetical protein EOO73_34240 [Myxococcales bacterium]